MTNEGGNDMDGNDTLSPAERAVLQQMETHLGMTAMLLEGIADALEEIDPEGLRRIMAVPDEKQEALISMLATFGGGLAALASVQMLLSMIGQLCSSTEAPALAEPTEEDVAGMLREMEEMLGETAAPKDEGPHRFTAGPDGEVEDRQ